MDKPSPDEPSSTRDRIMEAAIDLFTEQGFDKTSLREVADRVGVTKAALYYHFRSKEELLSSLIERVHGIGHHGLDVLGVLVPKQGAVDRQAVLDALEALLDQVLAQRQIFGLMERNRTAIEALGERDPKHLEEHIQLEQQWTDFIRNGDIPLRDLVRVSSALGALMAGAVGTTRGLGPEAHPGLRQELVAVLRDILLGPAPQ
ncbi:MAG: TetR/AcrR family transcriptional regulator [Candidatus Dormiibacterota bacterium]